MFGLESSELSLDKRVSARAIGGSSCGADLLTFEALKLAGLSPRLLCVAHLTVPLLSRSQLVAPHLIVWGHQRELIDCRGRLPNLNLS